MHAFCAAEKPGKALPALVDAALGRAGQLGSIALSFARQYGKPEHVRRAAAFVTSDDDDLAGAAVYLLGKQSREMQRELLAPLVLLPKSEKSVDRVRLVARHLYGQKSVDPAWGEILLEALHNAPAVHRAAIAGALSHVLSMDAGGPLRARARDVMFDVLPRPATLDPDLFSTTMSFLRKCGDVRAVRELIGALSFEATSYPALECLAAFPAAAVAAPLREHLGSGAAVPSSTRAHLDALLARVAVEMPEDGSSPEASPEVLRDMVDALNVTGTEAALKSGLAPDEGDRETHLHYLCNEINLRLGGADDRADAWRRLLAIVKLLVAHGADPCARLQGAWKYDHDAKPWPKGTTPRAMVESQKLHLPNEAAMWKELVALLGGVGVAGVSAGKKNAKLSYLATTEAMAVVATGALYTLSGMTLEALETLEAFTRGFGLDELQLVPVGDLDNLDAGSTDVVIGAVHAKATCEDAVKLVDLAKTDLTPATSQALARVSAHLREVGLLVAEKIGIWLVPFGPLSGAVLLYGSVSKQPKKASPGLSWAAPVSMQQEQASEGAHGVEIASGWLEAVALDLAAPARVQHVAQTKARRGKKGYALVVQYDTGG
ncbi:MAG: hypothetical protein H0T89_28840 [Deltaproteobacteria bacterium]|nr:hypothetical protein [Deltaproteobacteria bacterium]